MAASYRQDHVVYFMVGSEPGKLTRTPIGEVDGQITPRLRQVGQILASMDVFDVELRTDMDAWLKTHVTLKMPHWHPQ